jgi:hypothetical protein
MAAMSDSSKDKAAAGDSGDKMPPMKTLETLNARAPQAQPEFDDTLSIDLLKQIMKTDPPADERRRRYAERLLVYALETRDADAAQIAAAVMDADGAADAALWSRLEAELHTQPDAVYAFIRARLGEGGDAPARWLTRLRAAGRASLQVAISDGDAETVLNWLRLIAREPAAYDLGELLSQGLMAARDRAVADPMLARGIVALAIKRDADAAQQFLGDQALLAALPNHLGTGLRDCTGDALAILQAHGAEVFSTVLARAARAAKPEMFTPAVVEQVWALFRGGGSLNYLPGHAPADIAAEWAQTGASWLSDEALRTLLLLALRDREDDYFLALARRLSGQDRFLSLIADAFIGAERGANDALTLINALLTSGDLSQQAAVDLMALLLSAWDWSRAALPMMSAVARIAQAHPQVSAPAEVWWRLLEIAAELREEPLGRAALRRLTAELDGVEDDDALTEALLRMQPLTAWHPALRAGLMAWWRGFARAQPPARLQRLDKLFDGRKTLDELRAALNTVIAFRRMLGKRSLKTFTEDLDTAFRVLQGMSEGFDPSPRRSTAFDPAVIREELDARRAELTDAELKILTNTLKELANLIAELGDNRSRASLMRRGEDIDRQLITGEQTPHSAVDALKWMAGYLSGAQSDANDDAS